jgi:hypothetical protein
VSKKAFESILFLVISQVIQRISSNEGKDELSATRSFYRSQVYELLSNERTKLWRFSPLTLYNMYKSERETGEIDFPVEG